MIGMEVITIKVFSSFVKYLQKKLVLGRSDYARLKFGVGNEFPRGRQADYVLGKWSSEENETLKSRIEQAGKMVFAFGTMGLERTMSDFNRK